MSVDIITTVGAYIVTVGVVLIWVFSSRQSRVPRTLRTAVSVSLRALPLFLFFLLFCRLIGVNTVVALVVLGLFLWVVLLGWGVDPLSMGVWGVVYVIQQWILGWPDRCDTILDPPAPHEDAGGRLDQLTGRIGVTSCPLRPGGTIALAGKEYSAHSDLGYIERGKQVKVVGRRGTSLLVRPVEAEPGASGDTPGGTIQP